MRRLLVDSIDTKEQRVASDAIGIKSRVLRQRPGGEEHVG